MLYSADYFFNNRFVSRYAIMHKLSLKQNFLVPFINKIALFFALKDLETLEDARIYNYFFFFRFFFGYRAVFSGYKSFFNLGKTTFSVKIQLIMTQSDIYNVISLFSNDVFSLLDNSYISVNSVKISTANTVLNYVLKDMNLFVEKKTNVGLFNLKDFLNIRFFINTKDDLSPKVLLQSFKIYL